MPGIQDAIAAIMAASGQEAPQEANAPISQMPPEEAAVKDIVDVEPKDERNKPDTKNKEEVSETRKDTTSDENIKDGNKDVPESEKDTKLINNPHIMEALRALIAIAMSGQGQGLQEPAMNPVSQDTEEPVGRIV